METEKPSEGPVPASNDHEEATPTKKKPSKIDRRASGKLQAIQQAGSPSDPSAHASSTLQSSNEATKPSKVRKITSSNDHGTGKETTRGSSMKSAEHNSPATMAASYTKRNAHGSVGSVYSGNKIKHLKKEDGIPLWRKDIQLEFLRCVFENEQKVFTMPSDSSTGHTFADIYIDTMARSSKSSRVLRDKLLADRAGAMSMAMICLLVNVGRMNTTLNFFPEMRAQLRTFHAIPSLQANQDPNAYKQLQDAPRLKSILKGASEDSNQPITLDHLKTFPVPRTNPVHLIFLFAQYAPKVSDAHFKSPRDFFDLVMRPTLSSKSRARAFLWLIWWYLEGDFSAETAKENPFGPGQESENGKGLPIKVPEFDHLTEQQADAENIDTEEEIRYGELKRLERKRILEDDETVGPSSKKQRRGGIEELPHPISDNDLLRSPSPPSSHRKTSTDHPHLGASPSADNSSSYHRYPTLASKSEHPSNYRLVLKTRSENAGDPSSLPALSSHSNWNTKRSRHETSHQKAVNMNRKMQVDHILHQQMEVYQMEVRKAKRVSSSTYGTIVMNRLKDLPDMYDTDDETASWGPGGLVPNQDGFDDFGSGALRYKKIIERAIRRLDRADGGTSKNLLVKRYRRTNGDRQISRKKPLSMERAASRIMRGESGTRRNSGRTARRLPKQEAHLDDLDLELLGDNREEDRDGGTASDDTEVEDADMTEEDIAVHV